MADCVVLEGLAISENIAVNENDVLLGNVSEDSSNTVDSGKSSYFGLDESEALCSKYGVQLRSCSGLDGRMMRSNSEEFTEALKSIRDENGHNCRKKRCADRYDSSESSDSGVATLSCTDCSGSSSGTSDITEPGSPFSTSSHSESDPDPETCSPNKMPPTQSGDTSAWPWSDHAPSRYFLHTSASKRLKHDSSPLDNNNGKDLVLDDCLRRKCCKTGQQGKITEYFKTQLKSQKRCEVQLKKLAVHISGTVVPASELPLVFQRPQSEAPQHRKSLVSSHEPPVIPVTPAFRKPVALPIDSDLLPKAKTPSPLETPPFKTICSTPNSSSDTITSPLSVSTVEQCSDKPSLPSPILRTPSVIRFPARNGWKGHFLSDIICRWSNCDESFATSTALLEHLQVKHVNTQSLSETFVCHWTGCKVYDRASCSRSWLERHVLSHGGNKPFRCIVDGCGQRFSSQIMLERHVNQHFNQSENSSSSGASSKKSLESTPNKLFRRNGKKLRYRRQPFSARMFDFIDTGVMEGLQHSLLMVTKRQTIGQVDCISNRSINLHSKVIGRRTSEDGKPTVLLRWFPPDILRDEWVPESEAKNLQTRTVSSQQCDDFQAWSQPPLFRPRPSQHQRKQSATR